MEKKWWKSEHPCGRCGTVEHVQVAVAAEEGYVMVCESCLSEGERKRIDAARADSQDDHRGFYDKYLVKRLDGRDGPGERHHGCRYFVLDLDHDPFAGAALAAYAAACAAKKPRLSQELRELAGAQ